MRISESQLRRVVRKLVNEQGMPPAAPAASAPFVSPRAPAGISSMASEYGLTCYFDCMSPQFSSLPVGENVAEEVIPMIPGLEDWLSDTEAVIVPIGSNVVRFYESDDAMLKGVIGAVKAAGLSCSGIKKVRGSYY